MHTHFIAYRDGRTKINKGKETKRTKRNNNKTKRGEDYERRAGEGADRVRPSPKTEKNLKRLANTQHGIWSFGKTGVG